MSQLHSTPGTSAALPLLQVPAEEKRTLATLHRDLWRVVRRAPWWALGVPALAAVPMQVLLPLFVESGTVHNVALGVSVLIQALGYLVAVVAILELGAQGRVDRSSVMRTVKRNTWRYLLGYVLMFVAMMTGLVLLIIPGVMVMMRMWILFPVMVAEDLPLRKALQRSTQLYRLRPALMMGFLGLLTVLYWIPEATVVTAVMDEPMLRSVVGIPRALLGCVMPVIDVLLYAEIAGPKGFMVPVGVRVTQPVLGRALLHTGRRQLAMVAVVSVMLTAMAMGAAVSNVGGMFRKSYKQGVEQARAQKAAEKPAAAEDLLSPQAQ